MVRVFLVGMDGKPSMGETLCATLQPILPLTYLGNHQYRDFGASPQLELIDTDELTVLNTPASILVLKPKANLRKLEAIAPDTIVILDSANRRQLQAIARLHLNVMTVGLSAKDTLTFSSREEDCAVVSLQRSVRSLDGTRIEPMEIPCRLQGKCSEFHVLTAIALLVLCNQADGKPQITCYGKQEPKKRIGF